MNKGTAKKFLKFTYAAIKRYGDKTWTAHTGLVEINPQYTVSCGECEKGNFGDAHDTPYIIELSNGTKFLCFINDSLGDAEVLSEWGETANAFAARGHHDKVKRNINALNNTY